MPMNNRITAVLLTILVGTCTGCALTTETISIGYVADTNARTVPGAEMTAVSVTVIDKRAGLSKVSSKKNGFGMETAPILASEDVTVTIRRAMEIELMARGYRLQAGGNTIDISANLGRFYNDFKLGFWSGDAAADLNMTVAVKDLSGKTIYVRPISVQGIENGIQLMTGANAQKALELALQNGMRELFSDKQFLYAAMGLPAP